MLGASFVPAYDAIPELFIVEQPTAVAGGKISNKMRPAGVEPASGLPSVISLGSRFPTFGRRRFEGNAKTVRFVLILKNGQTHGLCFVVESHDSFVMSFI